MFSIIIIVISPIRYCFCIITSIFNCRIVKSVVVAADPSNLYRI